MNRDEYLQLVGLIRSNYEKPGAWEDPANYSLFTGFDADPVFEAYVQLRESGRYDDFPPKPPGVVRVATELVRAGIRSLPTIDETEDDDDGGETVAPGWKDGRASLGYDGLTVWEAARVRHQQMFTKYEPGAECKCPSAAHIVCHSKECDVHALIV